MYARVTTIQVPPQRVDEVVSDYHDEVLPMARRLPGFSGAHFLVERASGKVLAVSLWSTAEALQAAADAGRQVLMERAETFGFAAAPIVESFEVAVQSPPG
jgi:heme-degrading monooxygenase HmoA